MKTSSFVYSNTIPEIKYREKDVEIDFGLVVVELSYMELTTLLANLDAGLSASGKAGLVRHRWSS